MDRKHGFTLIELLIVVAIIGILAAIAVPNFLNAQVRAKVARVKGELRSFSSALELYRTDNGQYPYPLMEKYPATGQLHTANHIVKALVELTTPVAYMSSVDYADPFFKTGEGFWIATVPAYSSYTYVNYKGRWGLSFVVDPLIDGYGLASFGPDKYDSGGVWPAVQQARGQALSGSCFYHPSNGTVSAGDIVRYGGDAHISGYGDD